MSLFRKRGKSLEATTHDISIIAGGYSLHHSACWCKAGSRTIGARRDVVKYETTSRSVSYTFPQSGYLSCGCYIGTWFGDPNTYPKPCHKHKLITRKQARKEFEQGDK